MSIRVGINGFGRIGRLVARHLKARQGIDIVAINDLTSPEVLGYLFKHDSVHGKYEGSVEVTDEGLVIEGDVLKVLAERDPAQLPGASWAWTTSSSRPDSSAPATPPPSTSRPGPGR